MKDDTNRYFGNGKVGNWWTKEDCAVIFLSGNEQPFARWLAAVRQHPAQGINIDKLWSQTGSHNIVRTRHAFYAI